MDDDERVALFHAMTDYHEIRSKIVHGRLLKGNSCK
jgi:hypothetical protein